MRKIALLSDIHGNLAALDKVAEDLKTRQVDAVFNLGDHLSGPLWPRETLEFLVKQDWIHISGNHDRQLGYGDPARHGPSDRYAFEQLNPEGLAWLRALPAQLSVAGHFLLFHGTPVSDKTYLLETVGQGGLRLASQAEIRARLGTVSASVLLCGHTHLPRAVEIGPGQLIVNPGSVGLPAYDDDQPEYHKAECGSPHARYAILEQRAGQWIPEFILVAYDYQLAADQARRNGRPDWAAALQTGFVLSPKA